MTSCMVYYKPPIQLAIRLLDLAALSVENDMTTPFQLCGIVVPKLVYTCMCPICSTRASLASVQAMLTDCTCVLLLQITLCINYIYTIYAGVFCSKISYP